MISRNDLIAGMRARKTVYREIRKVACDSVKAIRYRDILDLYLYFSGAQDWCWQDTQGRANAPSPLWATLWNLAKDLVSWPYIYHKHRKRVARLDRINRYTQSVREEDTVVFLRTDHWFNIQSGGSVGHLSGVIQGLRALGHPTHVVSTDRLVGVPEDAWFHLCEPVYATGRNIPDMAELTYNDQILHWLKSYGSGWSPIFIYQRYSLGNYAGVMLKHHWQVPLVCEYNGSFPWMARQWGGRPLFHEGLLAEIELLNLQAADLVVVVSQPMMDELITRGIEPNRILVNPNGVCPDTYGPHVDGSGIRSQYGLEGKIVIGFIGTFGPWHGAEVLVESFGQLLEEHPEYRARVRLLLVGDGPTMEDVRQRLASVAAESILTGSVPQGLGPSCLAACDILASPHVPNLDGTPFFGSPTKLFEYMAMGKGIVASDLAQIGEVLTHERTALLVRPGDRQALKEGLKRLIDAPTLRDSLGQAARQEILENYSWREHTLRIIERLRNPSVASKG